mmetsp:Transcript_67375/g.108515  ORF Transcript_67375/g.108515 Transcript_67375/m.108515 type:complete len:503 (+) Transcript_67375:82-1590(+)
MRVGIITHGSRGDTQPYLALAQQLKACGHEVAICGPSSTVDLVQEHGIESYGMTFDCKSAIQSDVLQKAMASGSGAECVKAFMDACTQQNAANHADSPEEASAFVSAYKPDVIIGHPSLQALLIVAEKHQLPLVVTMFFPWLPSQTMQPACFTATELGEKGWSTKPLEAHKSVWDSFIDAESLIKLNQLRTRWGLKPYASCSEVQALYQALPFANCYSQHVAPEPRDLREEFVAKQTGYLFMDALPDYEPPMELLKFLTAAGQEKPLYVGFGSLSAGSPRLVTEKVLRALMRAGNKRCVIAGGWSGIGPEHLSPSLTGDFQELKEFADEHVVKVEAAPHSWLLPHCSGAVHHGGAGTTGAVARAGIPGAIAAFAWDQPWWAEQMETLGVGIALPAMITSVDVDTLAAAMARLSSDPVLAKQAATLGALIRSEASGSEQLVKFTEECLTAAHPWPTPLHPVPVAPLLPLWDRYQQQQEQPSKPLEPCATVQQVPQQQPPMGGA